MTELANKKSLKDIAQLVLTALFEGTSADAGAVLLVPARLPKIFDAFKGKGICDVENFIDVEDFTEEKNLLF